MMARLGPGALLAGHRLPAGVEIFAQRPAFRVEEMAAEEVDDARSAAQIGPLAGRLMPGEEGFEQMHMRVGASLALAARSLEEAGHALILEMGIEEGEGLLAEQQGIGIARHMSVRQCQQNAGMIVGVLGGIRDRTVDIQSAHPAAAVGAALAGHEVDAMADQPVGRAGPAARLGDGEGIDLPGLRTHALRLQQRRGVEAERLVEAAMALVDT